MSASSIRYDKESTWPQEPLKRIPLARSMAIYFHAQARQMYVMNDNTRFIPTGDMATHIIAHDKQLAMDAVRRMQWRAMWDKYIVWDWE